MPSLFFMIAMVATPPDKKKLRTGWTTGACSAAAAKAATVALLEQVSVSDIEITLPIGKKHAFKVERCEFGVAEATCVVVKDAGDDPDCTHGAHLTATVRWKETSGIELLGGSGVGVITKPGIGLPVGAPAINPIPRKNITEMVAEGATGGLNGRGLAVTISVPQGEEMAKKTQNDRLGILGGISILGTTGIVVPFSTGAYLASVRQGIDVAKAAGLDTVVLTTGGKSEEFAMKILGLPEDAFVQMGDYVGFSLRCAARVGLSKVVICGMPGKMSKIATGKMQTHAVGSQVDMAFLAGIAGELNAPPTAISEILAANTARHVSEIVEKHGITAFFDRMARKVCAVSRKHVENRLAVECLLTDFDGRVIGRHLEG